MSRKTQRTIEGILYNKEPITNTNKYKTIYEVKCYRPNIDGTLTLVKIINPTFRKMITGKLHQLMCKFPIDGDFENGPFCEEIFYSTVSTALYCQECRVLAKKHSLEMSKIRIKERKKQQRQKETKQINRNPKLPINKK
tara:strand:+ start:2553 stop:2969 length:417 start_codon:yes stop_codon:yes gene_type:complete